MHASGTFLCGRSQNPHILKNRSKFGIWRDAHGSISVQEGEPFKILKLHWF
jgi:hypothetical protein